MLGWILAVSWEEGAFRAGGGRWGFPLLSSDLCSEPEPQDLCLRWPSC